MPPVGGRPRVVLALTTRQQRQHARRQMGTLADLAVAPATLRRYIDAVDRFIDFLDARALAYPRTLRALDSLLSDYIELLWFEGDPKSWAANAISGIQHFTPSARHHLPGSWRLFGTWSRREMPTRPLLFKASGLCFGTLLPRAEMVLYHAPSSLRVSCSASYRRVARQSLPGRTRGSPDRERSHLSALFKICSSLRCT